MTKLPKMSHLLRCPLQALLATYQGVRLSRAFVGALHLGHFWKFPGNQKGFTLIEMVLGITLMSLMIGAAALAFKPVLDVWGLTSPLNESTDITSYALSRMSFETSQIKDDTSLTVANAGRLKFTDVSNSSIDYSLAGTNLMRNADILARGVQSVAFSYYDINNTAITTPQVAPSKTNVWRIVIKMTVQKGGQSVTMESEVHPRNFSRS